MDYFIDCVNFSFSVSGFLIATMGIIIAHKVRNVDRIIRRFFLVFFSVLMLYVFSNMLDVISLCFLGPGYTTLSRISVFFESFFSSSLMLLLSMMLIYSTGEHMKNLMIYSVFSLWAIYVILLIITQFTTFIYYFDDMNVYHRGPLYPLLLAPTVLIMTILLLGLIKRKSKLSKKRFNAFLLYILVPAFSMIIQMFFYGLLLIVLGTTISTAFMFLSILLEQLEINEKQQREIERQQANILVLQMRPHFIYNTLSSIYYLCTLDPKKAQQTVGNFNTYLRKNLNAIAKDDLIQFTEELEHTRAYLAVEKSRYEKLLFVEYDTPHTAFSLPPLTLQPIVENAVKHGVDPELPPLNIYVKTYHHDNLSVITVEDTGPGYTPAPKDDNSAHIGLCNVRERLELMCNGALKIDSRPEGGTIVTIIIPDKK